MKNRRWVVNHYYGVDQGRGWDLWDGRNRLPRHNETRVTRFVKVRGKASPLDPSLRDYWEERRTRRLVREASHFDRVHLLQRQAGRCAAWKAVFDPDLEQGGNTNIVVRDPPPEIRPVSSSTAGAVPDATRGRPRTGWPMLEPYAGKPVRTVLEGAGRAARPARLPDTVVEPSPVAFSMTVRRETGKE
jgi:hypothetical protein